MVIAELVMRSVSEVLRHLLAAIEHAGLDQESPGTGRQRAGACYSGGDAPQLPAHRGQHPLHGGRAVGSNFELPFTGLRSVYPL